MHQISNYLTKNLDRCCCWWWCGCCFFDLQIFVRDIFSISQNWFEYIVVNSECRPYLYMCVCVRDCKCAMCALTPWLLFHVFLISGLSKSTAGSKVVILVRLIHFVCIHLLNLSRACKICVCLSLSQLVYLFVCGILHFCNFIYRKRRLHRHSLLLFRVIFFSCFFSLSLILILLPIFFHARLKKNNNIKKWIENKKEYLSKLQVFKWDTQYGKSGSSSMFLSVQCARKKLIFQIYPHHHPLCCAVGDRTNSTFHLACSLPIRRKKKRKKNWRKPENNDPI